MINQLSHRSKKLIKYIKNYAKSEEIKLDTKTEKFLHDMYKQLKSVPVDIDFIKFRDIEKFTVATSSDNNNNNNNKYFPEKIQDYIYKSALYNIGYEFNIKERNIKLNFVVFSERDVEKLKNLKKYDRYAHNVYLVLNLLCNYADESCSKSININIYMTPFKKVFSKNKEVLGPININSGFSGVCQPLGNIVVYRKEEWFKVLIHETIHSLGLEFSQMNLSEFNKQIGALFPINSEFNIFEAYTDFWAVTLNSVLASFLVADKSKSFKCFVKDFKKYIYCEKIYISVKVGEILKYMGMTYIDLFEDNEKSRNAREKYNENTNIFAYFICKMILLDDYNKFIVWCIENNKNYIDFNKDEKTLESLFQYILKNHNSNSILNNVNGDNKNIRKHLSRKKTSKKKPYKKTLKFKNQIVDKQSLCLAGIEIE